MITDNHALSTQPYKGARDFYPEEMRIRNKIFEVWHTVCQSYGYEEYDAPIIEPVELFAAKSGDELVNQQSYNFTDRGGREVMLRPEMTPSVSRLVAGRRQELPLPIRWYSIPNCWRYERPQKGRGREFYQLNVDLFGVESIHAEIEMLQMIHSLLAGFDAKPSQYEIRVNSRKIIEFIMKDWLGIGLVETKTITRLIDRMNKIPESEFVSLIEASLSPALREKRVPERLLDILRIKDITELPQDVRLHESFVKLEEIISTAQKLGVTNIVYDITLMRGLDYYTDFIFEVFDTSPLNNRSIFGGGRYDGLVGLFGAEPIPTIGLGMSDVMLMEFLSTHGLLKQVEPYIELVVIPVGDTITSAQEIASQLRGMGVNISVDLTGRKVEKQLKAAIKSGVTYALFVGEQEIIDQRFQLKNLKQNNEELHSIERIVSIVKDHRRP